MQIFYSRWARISSGHMGSRSAGATSNTVRHPVSPRPCIRCNARAYATSTLAVNSGLESSCRLYSITWRFSSPALVLPVRITGTEGDALLGEIVE